MHATPPPTLTLVQEFPGQRLHYVVSVNGRLVPKALCGRHNYKARAWQLTLFNKPGAICRNCLRIAAKRNAKCLNQMNQNLF